MQTGGSAAHTENSGISLFRHMTLWNDELSASGQTEPGQANLSQSRPPQVSGLGDTGSGTEVRLT